MIQYKQQDLLLALDENKVNIILHQENCEGLNRFAGIAKLIHKKFPKLTDLHINHCKNHNNLLGSYIILNENDKLICNLYSQYYRGEPSNRYRPSIVNGVSCELPDDMEYRIQALKDSLKLAFENIVENITLYNLSELNIGIPLIASGLASNKQLKQSMSDLEYFKQYIYHIIEYAYNHYIKQYCSENNIPCSLTVYYL